jgi:hypothetical protein
MAKINGNKVLVFVDDVAIGCLTGCSLTLDKEEIITTCKDNDGAKTTINGGSSWGIDFDGIFESSSSVGFEDLFDLWDNDTEVVVRFAVDESGGLYFTGTGRVMNLKWDGPLNAAAKFSGKISPTSGLTKGTKT